MGIDLLRLVRCGNEGLDCVRVFVFPKLDVSRFIGKIDITFDGLIFVCKLSIYSDISAAISSITESLRSTQHHITPMANKYESYLIKLNSANLQNVCTKLGLGSQSSIQAGPT